MGKQIILIDTEEYGMWVIFYDKNFGLRDDEQYVCDLTPKQVLQIMNSESYQHSIDVETEVVNELRIEFKENKYFFGKLER